MSRENKQKLKGCQKKYSEAKKTRVLFMDLIVYAMI